MYDCMYCYIMTTPINHTYLSLVDSDDMFSPSEGGGGGDEGSDDEETIMREESIAHEV